MRRFARRRANRGNRMGRMIDVLGVVVLFALAATAAVVFDELSMRHLSGTARVVDGDTIRLEGERVRLAGIDAPELDQECVREGAPFACGEKARLHLVELIGERETACRGHERDRYGRLLMYCVCEGNDVNRAMVLAGWAVAYDDYGNAERAARDGRAGLWAGQFERPSEWRVKQGAIADIGPAGLAVRLFMRVRSLLEFEQEPDHR